MVRAAQGVRGDRVRLVSALAVVARGYARRGWAVFPLAGKHPRTKHGLLDASRDADQVARWWDATPDASIGVRTGAAPDGSGVWVLDLDAGTDAEERVEAEADGRPWRETLTARTGGGGQHLVYLYDADTAVWLAAERLTLPTRNGIGGKGLDVRSDGGYIVAVPSLHDSGRQYEWANRCDIVPAPEWLIRMVAKPVEVARVAPPPPRVEGNGYGASVLRNACAKVAATSEGGRHAELLRQARTVGGYLASAGIGYAEAETALCSAGVSTGKDASEVRRTVRDGLAHGQRDPIAVPERDVRATLPSPSRREAPDGGSDAGPTSDPPDTDRALERLTDLGNARRFVASQGRDFRWCPSTGHGGWLHWTGSRWEPDEGGAAVRAAKRVSRVVRGEVARAGAEATARAIAKAEQTGATVDGKAAEKAIASHLAWADTSEGVSRIDAVLTVARTEPEIVVRRDQLDADLWTFNTPTATLDLKNGSVRPNRREDLLMHVGGVGYDPNARCPRWAKFVDEVMDGDQEMVAYLQRIAGYCMVGVIREAAFFIFWGGGRNGKGTFVERIRKVLGSYAANTPTSTFVARRDGVPNDLAALVGKRMVSLSESEEGARLEEALVKQVTGKDPVSCRFMRAEWFDFVPQFTPILSCNDKPVVKGMGAATWGRLHLVPFVVSFEGREDLGLADALDAESAGILNWCLDGLAEWRDTGLRPPEKAKQAGRAYRGEMDIIGRFLEDRVESSPFGTVGNGDMYRAFVTWCTDNGERERSQRWLTQHLSARGYEQDSRRAWLKVGLGGA